MGKENEIGRCRIFEVILGLKVISKVFNHRVDLLYTQKTQVSDEFEVLGHLARKWRAAKTSFGP